MNHENYEAEYRSESGMQQPISVDMDLSSFKDIVDLMRVKSSGANYSVQPLELTFSKHSAQKDINLFEQKAACQISPDGGGSKRGELASEIGRSPSGLDSSKEEPPSVKLDSANMKEPTSKENALDTGAVAYGYDPSCLWQSKCRPV